MNACVVGRNLFCLFFVLVLASCKSLTPEEKLQLEIAQSLEEFEPIFEFRKIEKENIEITAEYVTLRKQFLDDLHYGQHMKLQTPKRVVAAFVKDLNSKKMITGNKSTYEKALVGIAFELIYDRNPIDISHIDVDVERDLTFAKPDGYPLRLDLYKPKKLTGKAPCVIFIHGGGWAVHKREWFAGHAALFAARGYVAVTVDYRMVHHVTPVECVQDVKAAVRWVRANADKYGIDTTEIGACGASAGGHLTAALATTGGVKALEGNGGNPDQSSRIDAAVGFATATLTGRKSWPIHRTGKKTPWFDKVSPYLHATEDDAPMFFIHGDKDGLVKIEEAKDLMNKYKDLGIQTELKPIKGAGHVFYMTEEMNQLAFDYFEKVFNK